MATIEMDMTRKITFPGLCLVLVVACTAPANNKNEARYYHLLVGTYTSGKSEGIYVYRFDAETGELSHAYTAEGIENPSFLAFSPDTELVYSVSELGEGRGGVSAFEFDGETGKLKLINQEVSGGAGPCYVSVDGEGQHVFAANYGGGSLSALPVQDDGSLGAAVQVIQHEGSSVNERRQEGPHVHCVVPSPDKRYLLSADLGTDRVHIYRYRPEDRQPLSPAETPLIETTPGSGPRHLTFDASGKYVYVTLELTPAIAVFAWNDGNPEQIQEISMLPEGFEGTSTAAEVRISPDGKFLYASARDELNEIVIYAIDPDKGTLTLAGRQSTLGKTPRNFMVDPTGHFLLVANQNSDNIVVFKRDPETGLLSETGTEIEVGNPVYLMMTEIRQPGG